MFLRCTCLKTLRVQTLARTRMTSRCAAFTTTHRVIYRVHNHAAVAGTTAEPAAAASLARTLQRVLAVAYDAHCGAAGGKYLACFARR